MTSTPPGPQTGTVTGGRADPSGAQTLACPCPPCTRAHRRPVTVPDTFAPHQTRTDVRHGLVWQANHPSTGSTFRQQTGITLA